MKDEYTLTCILDNLLVLMSNPIKCESSFLPDSNKKIEFND